MSLLEKSSSSDSGSDDETYDVVRGIDSHGRGWRRRRQQVEAELDETHDITNFRVKIHAPGCLPQWQTGPLVIPRLHPRYPEDGPPLPFAQTRLGSLPAELRLKIYGYAFGCPDRPIALQKRLMSRHESMRLLPGECRQPAPHTHRLYHDCWDGSLFADDVKLISMPLTCRQMRNETRLMLYSHRTFGFHNIEQMNEFLNKRSREQRDCIRSLSISTQVHYVPTSTTGMAFDAAFANIGDTKLWTRVCSMLCSMADLRHLRLYIARGRYTLWASMEYQLAVTLESLSAVQNVRDFQIIFAASEGLRERFVDAPFKLHANIATAERRVCSGCVNCMKTA